MGKHALLVTNALALPGNLAAIDFTNVDEATGYFINEGLASGAQNATPINGPVLTDDGVQTNGTNQKIHCKIADVNTRVRTAVLVYRPVVADQTALFEMGPGLDSGFYNWAVFAQADGTIDSDIATSTVSTTTTYAVGEKNFVALVEEGSDSTFYHGVYPEKNILSRPVTYIFDETNMHVAIGGTRHGFQFGEIEIMFFAAFSEPLSATELDGLLDENSFGAMILPTNLEASRQQAITAVPASRIAASSAFLAPTETEITINLPFELGQTVDFFAFDTDAENTVLTTGPITPINLEPLIFSPIQGAAGGPATGLLARIAGTVNIDGTPAEREIVVISDNANGRQVLGEGVSAPDGTFNIEYSDWGGAVIALALDTYGGDWTAETVIAIGTIIHPTTPNGYVYEATSSGTTGATEPVWGINGTVNDGSVTYSPKPFYRPIASGPIKGEILQLGTQSYPYSKLVSSIFRTTLAIKSDQTVEAWGDETQPSVANLPVLSDVVDVAAGVTLGLAVDSVGAVTVWGTNDNGEQNVPALGTVTRVTAGIGHAVVLQDDGTLVAWGQNDFGQANVPAGLTDVVDIQTGTYDTLALRNDGTVVGFGRNTDGQSTIPAGLTGVTAISITTFHALALKDDGTVVAWGKNDLGQCDVPAGLADVAFIAASNGGSLAIKTDGTLVTWGSSSVNGLPTTIANVDYLTAGYSNSYAVQKDGTIIAAGSSTYGQDIVPAGVTAWVRPTGGTAPTEPEFKITAIRLKDMYSQHPSQGYLSFSEIKLFDKDSNPIDLSGATATATSSHASFPPFQAIDGDAATNWFNENGVLPVTFEIQLLTASTISAIRIDVGSADSYGSRGPSAFDIEVIEEGGSVWVLTNSYSGIDGNSADGYYLDSQQDGVFTVTEPT